MLVPAAAQFASEYKVDPLDLDGAAIEIIGVVSMAVCLSVLEAGLAYTAENDEASPVPHALIDPNDDDYGSYATDVDPSLRAFEALRSKGLSVTQTESIGWAGFVNNADGKILSNMSVGMGLTFSSELPFKSLSLCFGEFRRASELMVRLYVAPHMFGDMTVGRKHMTRPDMEILSKHYTSELSCDF